MKILIKRNISMTTVTKPYTRLRFKFSNLRTPKTFVLPFLKVFHLIKTCVILF